MSIVVLLYLPSLVTLLTAASQDYVGSRLKQFSRVFAQHLVPNAPEHAIEAAYSRSLQILGAGQVARTADGYLVRFRHKCR